MSTYRKFVGLDVHKDTTVVAVAEAGGRSERVGMIDVATPRDGDRLKAAMRVLGKTGHHMPVVHAPAVDTGEVVTHLAASQ